MPILKRPCMVMEKAAQKKLKGSDAGDKSQSSKSAESKGFTEQNLQLLPDDTLENKLVRFRQSCKGKPSEETDQLFKKFLQDLGPKERPWSLWKNFESERGQLGGEQGKVVNQQYKELSGPGSDKKKKALLKTYLVSGLKDAYFQISCSFTKDFSSSDEQAYIPWKAAVDYWGLQELRARLLSGSLTARRNPKDDRLWEVSKETHTEKSTTTKSTTLTGSASTSKNKSLAQVMDLKKQSLTDVGQGLDSFDGVFEADDDDEEGGLDPGLKKLLGVKEPEKTQKNAQDLIETASIALENEDDKKAQSKVSQALFVTKRVIAKVKKSLKDEPPSKKEATQLQTLVEEVQAAVQDLENGQGTKKAST
ncbi:unnamed protein product [Symbiodinium sp. CCMP2592]|nr:unnamed protein product [Symbiodinium sp. CCMP2592]